MTAASLESRVAALEAAQAVEIAVRPQRDREIADIKKSIGAVDTKLDQLLDEKAKFVGALGLGKWLVGTGFFALVGSIVLATFRYISGRGAT